ncbi:MAG: AAA family ATPase [Planctomycetes bacterium]|nr:AAA family ATPase [Planctomycetota bacterium]
MSAYERLGSEQQYWIAVAGAPGSGKSTLVAEIKRHLTDKVTVIPMDGYHYYRHQLDAMDDPQEAHARRGAPFTFDVQRFVDDLCAARQTGSGVFPAFDHGVGDPQEHAIELQYGKQIVIVEGNYLLLDDSPWSLLKQEVFDRSWFLDVDLDECRRRLVNRHVETGLSRVAAQDRVANNDGPNAELVRDVSIKNANKIIQLESLVV